MVSKVYLWDRPVLDGLKGVRDRPVLDGLVWAGKLRREPADGSPAASADRQG